MSDLLLETTEIRIDTYRLRSDAAASLASRARFEDVAATYRRLADCWVRLAATIEQAETAEKRDAA